MDELRLEHPDLVRRVIAREWLRADAISPVLGSITLRDHQVDAARRVHALLVDAGGTLLCDEVGLGKTFVALAVARRHESPLVVAPAALRSMWLSAMARSEISIPFVSTESLSRARPQKSAHDLVMVDEAHHFRTASTARYRSLARLVARSRVLLVSATPLHNRPAELTALLALFLGSAARGMSGVQIARFVVRRKQTHAGGERFPTVLSPVHLAVPHDVRTLRSLLALPPPTPARDGGIAAAMVAHTLVRLWASSDAALREGLRRRLAKAVAIRHALESGCYPTRHELRAWSYGERSVQLGFPEILSPQKVANGGAMLEAVRAHERALVALLGSMPRESVADAARAAHIRALRQEHRGARIVVFAQFAESVRMLYHHLSREDGVAMLTARGARIASGPVNRSEALARFAPLASGAWSPKPAEEISLLIATDLLSEGVNLQDASIVVHFDFPWTAATLEQRVGRLARFGSSHAKVFVYVIDSPAPGADLLRAEAIIREKAALAEATLGPSRIPPLFARCEQTSPSPVEDSEAIHRALRGWMECESPGGGRSPPCAVVSSKREGVLALVTIGGRPVLLGGCGGKMSTDCRMVRQLMDAANGCAQRAAPGYIRPTAAAIQRWIESAVAADDAGRTSIGRSALARRLAARLARCLSACPLHERPRFSTRVAAINARIQSPLALGIEIEVDELLEADLSADEFVSGLTRILAPRSGEADGSSSGIRALLILRCEEESSGSTQGDPSLECGSEQ